MIARAAQLLNKTVSAFTVGAAVEKAENVVAGAGTTIMPAEQFDSMIAALDDPTPIPQIEALVQRSRRIDLRLPESQKQPFVPGLRRYDPKIRPIEGRTFAIVGEKVVFRPKWADIVKPGKTQ